MWEEIQMNKITLHKGKVNEKWNSNESNIESNIEKQKNTHEWKVGYQKKKCENLNEHSTLTVI